MQTLRRSKSSPIDDSILIGRTICIIEDDPSQLDILSSMLADAAGELLLFDSAEDALQLLLEREVDLILADVMMPGMDGWSLHSKIRNGGPNSQTPFIFTTCVISKNEEPLMSDVPAHTLSLAKPFDKKTLLRAIGRLFRRD